MINARVETVAERSAFGRALRALPVPDHRRRVLRMAAPAGRPGPASMPSTSHAPTAAVRVRRAVVGLARRRERGPHAALVHDPHDRRERRDRPAARPDAGDPRPPGRVRVARAPSGPTALGELLPGLTPSQTAVQTGWFRRQRRSLRRTRVPGGAGPGRARRRCSEPRRSIRLRRRALPARWRRRRLAGVALRSRSSERLGCHRPAEVVALGEVAAQASSRCSVASSSTPSATTPSPRSWPRLIVERTMIRSLSSSASVRRTTGRS